ncbi:hypothetical protein LPW11_21665 [Geomonas sp. RF6]|uniref:cytochrome c3 family protein n=1 Tax=Geomonas sp. RF6 TaxID=2897342 RepID=UPI001E2C678E|nr:cytochrome c3 family protein [Geomonas sp. RF6]UFS70464.1 hypothetical protein LPW11_21665 [Geomonas sp. RF6]
MLRKVGLLLTLALAVPSFAQAWTVTGKISSGLGSLQAGAGSVGFGTYSTGTPRVYSITKTGNTPRIGYFKSTAASQSFTVAPATGYSLSQVAVDGVKVDPVNGAYVVAAGAPAKNHTLVVYYTATTYTVSVVQPGHGVVTLQALSSDPVPRPIGSISKGSISGLKSGAKVRITAAPNADYKIVKDINGNAVTGVFEGEARTYDVTVTGDATYNQIGFGLVATIKAAPYADNYSGVVDSPVPITITAASITNDGPATYQFSANGGTLAPVANHPEKRLFTPTATTGVSVTVTATSASGASDSKVLSFNVKSADQASIDACTGCHYNRNPQFATTAPHKDFTGTCVSCHVTAHSATRTHVSAPASSCIVCHDAVQTKFSTSLHGTRPGKGTFYNDGLGDPNATPLQLGFGNYVDTPYSEIPCASCHNAQATTVDGVDTWTAASCVDCHTPATPATAVSPMTCYGCHSRQAYEGSPQGFGLSDVHFAAGMSCAACHSSSDMHGDGTAKTSLLSPGAITAACANCHGLNKAQGPISNIPEHVQHMADIDCSTCHIQSVVACYNCHFDNEGIKDGSVTHQKFASARFGGQGDKSWRFLVNRVMPDGKTKVYPGSMQSLMADQTAKGSSADDGQGVTFVSIAPYYSHSITRTGALRCVSCHGTATATNLAAGVPVDVVKWKAAAGVAVADLSTAWQGPKGVIPVPQNVSLLKFDFVDLVDPKGTWMPEQMNVASPRVLFKRGADAVHMPDEFVKPLTDAQMDALSRPFTSGATTLATAHTEANLAAQGSCANCHTSVTPAHNGGSSLQKAQYISTASLPVSCAECHADTAANKTALPQYAGSAHGNTAGEAWIHFDWRSANRSACARCHNGTAFVEKLGNENNIANVFQASDVLKPAETLACSACHTDVATGALRDAAPEFTINMTNTTATFNVAGASALCARCHSGRETGNSIKADTNTTGIRVFVDPHYQPAAATLYNKGYDFGLNDDLGAHKNLGATGQGPCVTCHMPGKNHSFAAAACITCHDGTKARTLDAAQLKADYDAALNNLKLALAAKGIHYGPVHPFFFTAPYVEGGANTPVTDWAAAYGAANWKHTMGAAYNYNLLWSEKGAYAHNYSYAMKLINDSIDFISDGALGL